MSEAKMTGRKVNAIPQGISSDEILSLCSKLVIRCNRESLAKRREALLWFGYHTRKTK